MATNGAPAPMVHLTTTPNVFAARVVAARLGSEGIVWELRGNVEGPYPVGEIAVLVAARDLVDARDLLLADEIESALGGDDEDDDGDGTAVPFRAPLPLWLVLGSILALAAGNLGRLLLG